MTITPNIYYYQKMEMKEAVAILEKLTPNENRVMYSTKEGYKITVTHTGKYSPKDFAVGLQLPNGNKFFPRHIRLLIDLYLKNLSNPTEATILFCAIEKIFKGDDPDKYISSIKKLSFKMQIEPADVNLLYTQLLMIEQDFNFIPLGPKFTHHKPAREFLMCFIRWVASGGIEDIDTIITTAAIAKYPPAPKFKTPIDCSKVSI